MPKYSESEMHNVLNAMQQSRTNWTKFSGESKLYACMMAVDRNLARRHPIDTDEFRLTYDGQLYADDMWK